MPSGCCSFDCESTTHLSSNKTTVYSLAFTEGTSGPVPYLVLVMMGQFCLWWLHTYSSAPPSLVTSRWQNLAQLLAMASMPYPHRWAQTTLQVMDMNRFCNLLHHVHGILCSLQNWQMNFTVSSLKFPSMQTRGAFLRWSANCRIYLPVEWTSKMFILLTYIVGLNFLDDIHVTDGTVWFSDMIQYQTICSCREIRKLQ